jgi:hypothetical protein
MANLTVKPADTVIIGSDSQSHSALYAGGNHPHDNYNSRNFHYQKRGRGNYRGHFRGRARGRSSFSKSDNIQCQIYLKWGHTAAKYYHRFNIAYIVEASTSSSITPSPVLLKLLHKLFWLSQLSPLHQLSFLTLEPPLMSQMT